MKLKMKLFIVSLLILVLCSVAVVSANENVTDDISLDNSEELAVNQDNDEILSVEEKNDELGATVKTQPVKAKIYASNYNSYYDSSKKLQVQVKDLKGNPLKNVWVKFKLGEDLDYGYTGSNGKCSVHVPFSVGNHKATIVLDDDNYVSNPIKVKVKITKAPVKISAKKIKTNTKSYFKLKATVKDKQGNLIKTGKVKFNINGKSYKVKVKDGVATKKLKLKTAKTYTYKAIFSSTKNYNTNSASSKVVVKKVYIIKKGKYSFKLSERQYKRIQYVKNHKYVPCLSKYADFKVKTGQTYNGMPVHAIVTTWSGIRSGHYYNYPQVQFVVMYGSETWEWDYLTNHYTI